MSGVNNTAAYQERVLSSILSSGSAVEARNRFIVCMQRLGEDFFLGRYRAMYQVLLRYFKLTGYLIGESDFADAVRAAGLVETAVEEYVELYRRFSSSEVSDGDFKFAVERLIEQTKVDRLGVALADTMEILLSGKKQGSDELFGYDDARLYLSREMSVIDQVVGDVSPDGNINEEARDILAEYAEIKARGGDIKGAVLTGIAPIDRLTGGAQPGELWLLAAYTGEGKTTLATNIAWHACYEQGMNVVFATGETLRGQVRRKLISRHSRMEKFNCPDGIRYEAIKRGSLSLEQEALFQAVLSDMATNEKYGRMEIFQFPLGATVSYIQAKLMAYEAQFPVGLVVIDYLGLLNAHRRRGDKREEVDDIIQSTKRIAVAHANGRGVPILSPYQVSRSAWEEARSSGRYSKSAMANSAEAERTADLIWTLLRLPEHPDEVRCSVIKYRDGDEFPEFYLDVDSATSYMGTQEKPDVDLLDLDSEGLWVG